MIMKADKSAGFTLLELLVSLALGLVMLTSISSAFVSQRKSYDAQEQMTEMIQGTRAVMEIITREVKLAGFNPTGSASLVGVPYSTSQLEIRADLNGDGETDGTLSANDTNEKIIYRHDATNMELERDAGQAFAYARLLAENIQSFTFNYMDVNGNATATPADIRMVEISITSRTAKPDPDYAQNNGYRTYTLTSTVSPPNLALN